MATPWRNWAGTVAASPAAIHYPASEAAIQEVVRAARAAGQGLRVVGSGHSFTPLVATGGTLASLEHYTGVERIDQAARQATVRAGTPIRALGAALHAAGLAQPNLGDIDVQSIAGAISTGTHGSGATLGSLSTQVATLTLVTADGSLRTCSPEVAPEVFRAAQVSLGVLGIISRVTLQLVPAFTLDYTWRKMSLRAVLANVEQHVAEHRHFEFFWMPYTDAVLAKFMDPTPLPPRGRSLWRRFNDGVLENGVFWLLSEYSRHVPRQAPGVSRLIGALVSSGRTLDSSHRIFATERLVKFVEMEYAIPRAHFAAALEEIDATIRRQRFQVHFPIECRFVAGDDIFLSPASGRDSAYIAVHMYRGMPYRRYFAAMEAILAKYEGRPHWGKLHTRRAADLRRLYPAWDRFAAVRQTLDPTGLFLNDYLRTLFGVPAPDPT